MKHHKADGQHSFIETVKARQRNVVWPDPLRNSRAVDVFLWRGSTKPPLVQRIETKGGQKGTDAFILANLTAARAESPT
jgi:hypothetical protein